MVAIVVPDYEVVYRWAKREKLKVLYSPENLYSSVELKKALLQDLHAIAKRHNLQDIKTITNIHIENCIIPEVLLLQRQLLHQKYEHILEQLKSKSKPLCANHKPVRFATTLAPTRDHHVCPSLS